MPRDNMSALHIAQQAGTFEPQRVNNFTFQVHLASQSDANIIELSLDTGFLPQEGNAPIMLSFLNEQVYVAGKVMWQEGTIVLKDFVDQPTAEAIRAWRSLVYDPFTGRIGFAANYKKSANIIMYTPDGLSERTWELIGCWPMAVSWGALDMNASDANRITVTIRFDKARPASSFQGQGVIAGAGATIGTVSGSVGGSIGVSGGSVNASLGGSLGF